jgi:hypothetical protein
MTATHARRPFWALELVRDQGTREPLVPCNPTGSAQHGSCFRTSKCSGVARISVSLELLGERANLQLRADGTGIGQHEMKGQFTTSTTELGAYLVRIEAAGGTVQCTPAPTTGLIVTVSCRQRPSRSAFPLGRYGLLELVECH